MEQTLTDGQRLLWINSPIDFGSQRGDRGIQIPQQSLQKFIKR